MTEIDTRPKISPTALRDLPLEHCTLPSLLQQQAEAHSESTLLTIDDRSYTYTEVRDLAAQTAGMLHNAGVEKGQKVAIMARNRLEVIQLVLGCAWLGVVAVPLNADLRGPQVQHVLENSEARVIGMTSSFVDRLVEIDLPSTLTEIWCFDEVPDWFIPSVVFQPMAHLAEAIPPAACSSRETAIILYTSGTTGVSEGVMCAQAQPDWWGVSVADQLGISADDVLYTSLPLFHTNALNAFVQALVTGAQIVIAPRFSASEYWSQIRYHRATVTYLLGAMINILWSKDPKPDDSLHSLRIALSPATPVELATRFQERFGFTLVDGFGSTETNSTLSAAPYEPRPGYVGVIQPGYEALVVDENDVEVPDGVAGELLLRSHRPFAFATGYYNMPAKTVESWRNLWFHTGDRVIREPDGWFKFVDRIKDVIRRRGENISSFEVEQVIGVLPAVQAVAAFPVKAEMAEDEVMVAITTKQGTTLTPEEIIAHCETRLPRFSIPRFIDLVDNLPTTANGKIRKNVLRDRGRTRTTWDSEASTASP